MCVFDSGHGGSEKLWFELYQSCRTRGSVERVCCGGVGDVGGWLSCTRVWEGVVVLCICMVCVWMICVDGRSRYVYCAWRIPVHLRCNQCSILLLPYVYLSVADIANPDLFACGCRTCISHDIANFHVTMPITSTSLHSTKHMLQCPLLAHPCTLDDLQKFNENARKCVDIWKNAV